MQTSIGEGMQTMDQALQHLVDSGRITREEAYWKASDKSLFTTEQTGDVAT